MSNYTFFTRALRYKKVKIGWTGLPVECVAKVFGEKYAAPWCGVRGSEKRCAECWQRQYVQIRKKRGPRKKRGDAD